MTGTGGDDRPDRGVGRLPHAAPRHDPQAVLFVCTHNAVRSPMAAALLSEFAGKRLYVRSAGLRPGEPDAFVEAVMREYGIDLSAHRAASLEDLDDMSFDLIVTLSPEAHHRVLDLTRVLAADVEYWPTDDPTATEGTRESLLAAYRALRDRLIRKISERFGPSAPPRP